MTGLLHYSSSPFLFLFLFFFFPSFFLPLGSPNFSNNAGCHNPPLTDLSFTRNVLFIFFCSTCNVMFFSFSSGPSLFFFWPVRISYVAVPAIVDDDLLPYTFFGASIPSVCSTSFLRSSSNLTRFRVRRGSALPIFSPLLTFIVFWAWFTIIMGTNSAASTTVSHRVTSLSSRPFPSPGTNCRGPLHTVFPDINLPFPDTAVLGGNFTSSSTTMVISSSGGHPNGVLSPFTTNTVLFTFPVLTGSLTIPFISRGAPSACVTSMSASRNLLFRFTRLYVSSLINDTDAPVSTKALISLPPISALQDSSFSCFLFRCPGLLQNQHLLVGQLAAKWPARPHVQHFALSLFNWVGLVSIPGGTVLYSSGSPVHWSKLLFLFFLTGPPSLLILGWPAGFSLGRSLGLSFLC
ncbi:unnamed protein product [Acanthosepion pharaonis]|uniref:Uncharacterized protein n=1 Tax=Acanthosepion pharaonis TaxID=158019 RepID=A0A812D1I4_ACAPH|nr:unnamed protein product [Sepia pharaonis]